jgi:hypothetical protein
MSTNLATRLLPAPLANFRFTMPDSRDALLRDAVQTANDLREACPEAAYFATKLVGLLNALGTVMTTFDTPAPPRESYAHIRSLYEASIEFLHKHQGEEITEEKLMEGLRAGNAFQSELAGFQRRLRQALNNKKRTDIERIGRGGDPALDIIRLRPTTAKVTQLKKR